MSHIFPELKSRVFVIPKINEVARYSQQTTKVGDTRSGESGTLFTLKYNYMEWNICYIIYWQPLDYEIRLLFAYQKSHFCEKKCLFLNNQLERVLADIQGLSECNKNLINGKRRMITIRLPRALDYFIAILLAPLTVFKCVISHPNLVSAL